MAPGTAKTVSKTLRHGGISAKSAIEFIDGAVGAQGVPGEAASVLGIISDEIVSNIVNHSGAGELSISVSRADGPRSVTLEFSDDGPPFDPLAHADPDTSLPLEERKIGGLGILMVKRLADAVAYERRGGRNVLAVTKRF
jgi:sigma-B regulation protein RsbU (phosphoserine phosphatase)